MARGWSRAQISAAASISVLFYGFMGPFSRGAHWSFRARPVMSLSLAVIAAGAALAGQATQVWHLWFTWGFWLGSGRAALHRCSERRSRIVGLFNTVDSSSVCSRHRSRADRFCRFNCSLACRTDDRGSPFHDRWRSPRRPPCRSSCSFATNPKTSVCWRTAPRPIIELLHRCLARSVRRSKDLASRQRSGAFWLLFGSFLVCGLSTNGLIGTHFISAAGDHGIARHSAAAYMTAIGVLDVVGTLTSGWLSDRIDPRRLLFFYYGLRGLSLFMLEPALTSGSLPLWGFIVFYGLDWVATVPPTIKLCSDVGGPQWSMVMYGWVFAGHQLGAAVASWGAAALRDASGSYRPAWIVSAVACLIAAFGVLRIKSRPRGSQHRRRPHPTSPR